jgi:ADP-heptose:LPS heptosyltransferase
LTTEGIVFDITHKFENFAITADYIANLDLVISVDSAVAHIAGAIGKPCLMLSPYTRCWRWWGKSHGWPWYNRMAVYYQSENGNWDSAMKKVISAVREAKVK